jgi:hypothetical protein
VPLRDGAVLELTAHRSFLEASRGDTGHDRVIEQIIGTLAIDPRRAGPRGGSHHGRDRGST